MSTESEVDDAAIISIDSKGIDIRVRQGAQVIVLYTTKIKKLSSTMILQQQRLSSKFLCVQFVNICAV